jgi:CheY-like chemotaxis protein
MDVILTRMGYQIRGYTDPTLALQDFRARRDDFDVVITDVAMPGITGPHLAQKLREIRKDVPIIMTSGYIRDEDREAARALQINQLVYKSDTVEELAEALSKEIATLNATRA